MKKSLQIGFIIGIILFVFSYGGLFLAVKFFPHLFLEYNNPLFNSNGSRDWLFYTHAFVISFALTLIWQRFKTVFKGNFIIKGIEFGCVYAVVALLPVMWITFSSLDITFTIVASWFLYGLIQAIVAGIFLAKFNP